MSFDMQFFENLKNMTNKIHGFILDKANIDISIDLINQQIESLKSAFQNAVAVLGPKIIISITSFMLFVFVTFFLMYYLLINTDKVICTFRDYFPLSYKNVDILLYNMGKDTKNLILGQLLIATIQGSLGGVGFLIFGVSGYLLWGLVMVIMAFIPFLGAFVIWLPASIALLLRGDYMNGIGLIIWGAVVVGTIDNILRPKITSAMGNMHPVTVLLGVFIGLKEWGIIGLVIGPLIISVLFNLIKMFREEYIEEPKTKEIL